MPKPKKTGVTKSRARAASPLRELENAFHTAKTKLASQYEKELSTLTKDFAKVKKAVRQLQAKKKVAKNKRVSAMKRFKGNATKAAKDQVKTAKSLYDTGVAELSKLQTQASQLTAEIQRVKFVQHRFMHALKAMTKAEQVIAKKQAKAAVAKKGRKRRTKKPSTVA